MRLAENERTLCDKVMPGVLFLLSVLYAGMMVQFCSPREQPMTWHERYVKDSCERCERDGNECCVYIPEGP